jgi:RNA polymerase sigma-70 factor (ECF subfamily)
MGNRNIERMRDQDQTIIRRIRAGDHRAYNTLVDRYKEKGMGLAMRMLRHREEAEEALQDAFVRAYRALADFEERASFGTWFYRILFNVCTSRLETRKTSLVSIDEEGITGGEMWPSDEPLPDAEYDSREFQKVVEEEIAVLPEPFGSTFALFALREMSYEEIADVVGAPLGTVKARIFRARAMLRRSIPKRLGIPHVSAGIQEGERS